MVRRIGFKDFSDALTLALRREASETVHAIPPMRAALVPPKSAPRIDALPPRLRTPDTARGAAILDGRFAFCGDTLTLDDENPSPWARPLPSREFAVRLHGFHWLRDLLSCADAEAPEFACQLADQWIGSLGRWNSFSWSSDVLPERVIQWLEAGDILFAGEAGQKRLASLDRQIRHLKRTATMASDGRPRLKAAFALSLGGICLGERGPAGAAGLALLEQELDRQIFADGGHVSRAPQAAADTMIDLVTLDAAAEAANQTLPEKVRRAIDRIAPVTRFFRMHDGGLACFHGGGAGDRKAIETALSRSKTGERSFGYAPHSGYQRSEAGGATVILDAGKPAGGALGTDAHASALAMEFSAPGGRLIVNCGWSDDQPRGWRQVVRATAAHSTLTLEETSSCRLVPPGRGQQILGPRFLSGPGNVTARRTEEEIGLWLEASHDGYRAPFGLMHRRRIFLAADGGDLRGEDALSRPVEDGPPENPEAHIRFAIRFHLHPGVRASLSRDAMSALLVLPTGDGWRFRTDGGPVRIERSVYLGGSAPPKRTSQLVISGEAEPYGAGERPPNRVRWAFQRLGRVGNAAGKSG